MPRNKQKNKAKSGGGGASAPAAAKPNVAAKEEKVEAPVAEPPVKSQEPAPLVEQVETSPAVVEKPKEVTVEEPSKSVTEVPIPSEASKSVENGEVESQTLKKKRNRNKKNKNQQQQGDENLSEVEKPEAPVVTAAVETKPNQQNQKKQNNKGKQQNQPAKPTQTPGPVAVTDESAVQKPVEAAATGTAKRRNRNRRNKNKSNTTENDADEAEVNEAEVIAEKLVEAPKDTIEQTKEISVEATVQVEEKPVNVQAVLNKGSGKQDNKKSKQDKKQQGKHDNNKKTNIIVEPSKEPEPVKPDEVTKIEEVKPENNKQNKKQQNKQDKKTSPVAESPKPKPEQSEAKTEEVTVEDVKPAEPVQTDTKTEEVKIEDVKPSEPVQTDVKPQEFKPQHNDNKQSPKSNKKNNSKNNKQEPFKKQQQHEEAVTEIQGNFKLESKTESTSEIQLAENASEIVSEPKVSIKPEVEVAQAEIEVKTEVTAEVLPEPKPEALPQTTMEIKPEIKPDAEPEVKPEVKSEIKPEAPPEIKPDVRPAEPEPEVKVETKSDVKPEAVPEIQPEVTVEAKPEIKSESAINAESEAKAELKPEAKPEVTIEVKSEAIPEPKPAEVEHKIQEEAKSEIKQEIKQELIPEIKPEVIPEVKPEIIPVLKPEIPKPIPAAVAAVTPSQHVLKPQQSAEPKHVELKQEQHGGKGKNKQQQKKQDKKSKTPEPKPVVKSIEVTTPPAAVDQPAVLELSTPPLELKLSEPKIQQKPEIKPKPLFNKPEERKLNIQAIPDPIASLKKTPSPVPFISPTREFEVKLVPEIPFQDKIELKVDTSLPVSPHLSKKDAEKQLISEALSELIDAASVPEPIKIDGIKTISDKTRIESQPQTNEDTKSTTSSSKNEGGSDFVLSANAVIGDDTTKSLKSVSPTENKRTKDELNAKQTESGDEKKLHELPEKTPQEKIEGVQFASKLLEILDAVMVASPEQKLALRAASEKLSGGDGDKYKNTDKQQNVDNKNKTGAKPKNQPTSPTTTAKPEIPPKPEHLVSKNKNQKQQQNGGGNNKKKPDLLPKPGKDKIPPISQKQQQSSNSKNLQTVPTPPPQTSESWNDATKTNLTNSKNLNSAPTPAPPKQPTTDKGWSTKQNKKPKKSSPDSKTMTPVSTSSTGTTTRTSPPVPIQLPPELQNKKIPNIAEMLEILSKARGDLTTANSLPLSSKTINPKELIDDGIDDDEDEEYYEYKFIPRQVFLASNCVVCQLPLQKISPCKKCQMVAYCSDKHEKLDASNHKALCQALYEIAEKRGGHVFRNAKVLTDDEYRSLRVHTMNLCQTALQRPLQPFEREIILFPRLCAKSTCRESNPDLITNCKNCQQAAYCIAHEDHLNPDTHQKWCKYFDLYKKIVIQQKKYGKIEPTMPTKMAVKPYKLPKSINHVFSDLYKNFNDLKDDGGYSILTQLATAPLTALYCAQRCDQPIGDVYTIHLVGAEIQFEADMLDKWEAFFLHLVPNLVELKIVFIGPELNSENLPLDILSRIRMCRACRQSCRAVRFDFQCGKLYHSYCKTSSFSKPDLICFFNPGLHRPTGFRDVDTWPETIVAATDQNCPIIVTSYTELESPKDYERLVAESKRKLNVIQESEINPYSSYRPERNFISDEIAPMIFKNYFYFIVK